MKIALVVPHIFMHRDILPHVIFSPGTLAIDLAEGLQRLGVEVTLCTPGPVDTTVPNDTADMRLFEQELALRGDTYMDLLKKHPFTFITLARQVQSEIIADVFARANNGEFDLVHIYTNEEDMALPFAALCQKPVVFTHHDPFNFLIKYKSVFPKYRQLNWLSMSLAQRSAMPPETNWVANIYHGLAAHNIELAMPDKERYVAYLGRIIAPKGVHLAIAAVQQYNQQHADAPLRLKIAGKHYTGTKDTYWRERIMPQLADPQIEYVGFIQDNAAKQRFLGGARGLIVPSTFDEPFGMVMIEALAAGTPLVGLCSGAIPEIIDEGTTGYIVQKDPDDIVMVQNLCAALEKIETIDRRACRRAFEARFTLERMCRQHLAAYETLIK